MSSEQADNELEELAAELAAEELAAQLAAELAAAAGAGPAAAELAEVAPAVAVEALTVKKLFEVDQVAHTILFQANDMVMEDVFRDHHAYYDVTNRASYQQLCSELLAETDKHHRTIALEKPEVVLPRNGACYSVRHSIFIMDSSFAVYSADEIKPLVQ
jgi:hypothetical protein